MPPSGPPTEQEIWKITRRTTEIIQSNITPNVCLFGSAACALWTDIDRVPNDIDMVVSNGRRRRFDADDIKHTIAEVDDRYYLEPSKIPGENYWKLYCRLPGWATDETRRVKVDILVPPTLNIPRIKASEAIMIYDIPVMPISSRLSSQEKCRRFRHNCPRHSPAFMNRAYALANEFVNFHGRRRRWRALGFEV